MSWTKKLDTEGRSRYGRVCTGSIPYSGTSLRSLKIEILHSLESANSKGSVDLSEIVDSLVLSTKPSSSSVYRMENAGRAMASLDISEGLFCNFAARHKTLSLSR